MQTVRWDHRLLVVLAALVTLALASCGVAPGAAAPDGPEGSTATTRPAGDDDTATSTTTDGRPERSAQEEVAIGTVAGYYEELGLDPEDARCLADSLFDLQGSGTVPSDPSELMELFTTCGISLEDLTALNEELTEGGADPLTGAITKALGSLGLDDEQAACVADRYAEEYGPTDLSAMADQSVLAGFLEDCGIDPSEIQPGG